MHLPAKPLFLKVFSSAFGRTLFVFATLAGIVGCSALAPRPLPTPDEGFVVSGRLALRNGEEGFSSNFIWEHAAEDFVIELWGPLGQGRSRLEGRNGEITLHTADGSVHHEASTETAVRRWLGIDVPVTALTFWIKGERAPDTPAPHLARDAAGDLIELEQLTWVLEFSKWTERPDGRRLPGRIVATKDAVKVTLLPKEWAFPTLSG